MFSDLSSRISLDLSIEGRDNKVLWRRGLKSYWPFYVILQSGKTLATVGQEAALRELYISLTLIQASIKFHFCGAHITRKH